MEHLAKEGRLLKRPWKALCDFVTLGEYISLKHHVWVLPVFNNVIPTYGDKYNHPHEFGDDLGIGFTRKRDFRGVVNIALRYGPDTSLDRIHFLQLKENDAQLGAS